MNKKKHEIKYDTRGKPFSRPVFWLDPDEYAKICSEINDVFESQYKGQSVCSHRSYGTDGNAYMYWFENHGFDDYNIFMRFSNNH